MKRETLCILLLGISLFAAPFPCLSQDASDPETPSDGVFIHLTSGPEKVHRTLMALRMAVAMSQEGKPVYLYCDVDAVQLVVKGAPDLKHEAFPSSLQLITDLAANGVTIAVSPACLKAAGFTPEDLLPEIRIASRSDFFQFTPGRILSLSY